MKKIFSILLFANILTIPFSYARPEIKKQPFFPIIGHNFLWQVDELMVHDQAEMGLTLITVSGQEDLDFCQKAGIKGLLWSPAADALLADKDNPVLVEKYNELINKFRNHPAFFGMALADEPGKRVFPGYKKAFDVIKKALPDKPVYTNLFPSWSQPYQHGYKDYQEYLEAFASLYASSAKNILTFDNYRNLDNRLTPAERKASFLENLNTVSRITQKYNLPFWATVSSCAHDHYPDPNAADLEFEVFTSLAHGAKGISYFTTVSHQNHLFQGGPFNMLGDKTPLYTIIRELNFRVRKMAPILLTLKSTGTYFSIAPAEKIAFSKYPMHKMLPGKLLKSIKSDRSPISFLVGEFIDDKNAPWVMIVNLDLKKTACFSCELIGNKRLQSFNSYTGTLYPPQISDPWLRPGQGKLYKVIDK